jgi:hypothetical protein
MAHSVVSAAAVEAKSNAPRTADIARIMEISLGYQNVAKPED